jgi:hypothetical protein
MLRELSPLDSFVASAGIPFVCISAPNLVDKASSTSMGGRIDGLVADGEEVQDHRVPLRKASSIPSGTSCPSPAYIALSVFLFVL